MSIKKVMFLAGFLASFGASAQMPVPLLDSGAATAQAEARKQLETLLACRNVKSLDAKAVASQFEAIGLVKGVGGYYLPPQTVQEYNVRARLVKGVEGFYLPAPKGEVPSLFGDQVLAANVDDDLNLASVTVYLKGKTAKQIANKLGVTQIDDEGETDEPSYVKQTGKKSILWVFPASAVYLGNGIIKHQSAVKCQITK